MSFKPYLPSPDKLIWHPKDIEYFKEYPAPVMENLHRLHFCNINATIPFFSLILYGFACAIEAHKVLEIGSAEGYSAFYLAHAVKFNGLRYQVDNGMYYGIDITQTELVKERLDKEGLPNTLINMDSINLSPDTFKDITFDLIFQDGCHETDHVLHELEVLYPQLKGNGRGYWLMHDIFGPASEAYQKILEMIPDKYNFQHCAIHDASYGLGIFRKMEK